MKRSRFVILPICTCVATITPICACSNGKTEAEKIADAIFGPVHDNKQPEKKTKDFPTVLKGFSDEERKNELLYDLFGFCNEPDYYGIIGGQSFWDLYKDNVVTLQTLVTKCDFSQDLKANFLGYITFIFNKEQDFGMVKYQKNDYVQITYNLSDLTVQHGTMCNLIYHDQSHELACIGFIKQRYDGGKEHMYFIKEINTYLYSQTKVYNSQNYIQDLNQ